MWYELVWSVSVCAREHEYSPAPTGYMIPPFKYNLILPIITSRADIAVPNFQISIQIEIWKFEDRISGVWRKAVSTPIYSRSKGRISEVRFQNIKFRFR